MGRAREAPARPIAHKSQTAASPQARPPSSPKPDRSPRTPRPPSAPKPGRSPRTPRPKAQEPPCLHTSWSEELRRTAQTTRAAHKLTFGDGIGVALCSEPCERDCVHDVVIQVLSADTYLTIGMAPPTTAQWNKQLGMFAPSVGLRDDGAFAHDAAFAMGQGTFAAGDFVRMEYCPDSHGGAGTLRWYHGVSRMGLLLAEAEDIPRGWHFGVSGIASQVELLAALPETAEMERRLEATRQQHQERLAQVKSLTETVQKVKTLSAEEVAAAAQGSTADATRFAINSALLAVPELACGGDALNAISLPERHQALVSGSASSLLEQLVAAERRLQQEQLKAAFAAATEGLMEALAPHLGALGVSLNDTLPNGQHIVASLLEAASAGGVEQLKALMANPRELARHAAAVKTPTATLSFHIKLDTAAATAASPRGMVDYRNRFADLLGVYAREASNPRPACSRRPRVCAPRAAGRRCRSSSRSRSRASTASRRTSK